MKQPAKEFDQSETPNVKQKVKLTEELAQTKVKINRLTEERDQAKSELSICKQKIQSLNQRLSEVQNVRM